MKCSTTNERAAKAQKWRQSNVFLYFHHKAAMCRCWLVTFRHTTLLHRQLFFVSYFELLFLALRRSLLCHSLSVHANRCHSAKFMAWLSLLLYCYNSSYLYASSFATLSYYMLRLWQPARDADLLLHGCVACAYILIVKNWWNVKEKQKKKTKQNENQLTNTHTCTATAIKRWNVREVWHMVFLLNIVSPK